MNKGQYEFYQVDLGSHGLTISLTVTQGEIAWFFSTDPSQSRGNEGLIAATTWYSDAFIDPANFSYGTTLYITLLSNALRSDVSIEASYGDISTKGDQLNTVHVVI